MVPEVTGAAVPVGRSNPSRILRLALLAPDIVEAILGGWADQRVMLERLERPLPVGWEEQRGLVRQPSVSAGGARLMTN